MIIYKVAGFCAVDVVDCVRFSAHVEVKPRGLEEEICEAVYVSVSTTTEISSEGFKQNGKCGRE